MTVWPHRSAPIFRSTSLHSHQRSRLFLSPSVLLPPSFRFEIERLSQDGSIAYPVLGDTRRRAFFISDRGEHEKTFNALAGGKRSGSEVICEEMTPTAVRFVQVRPSLPRPVAASGRRRRDRRLIARNFAFERRRDLEVFALPAGEGSFVKINELLHFL